jgi:signal transduction histidine kinase
VPWLKDVSAAEMRRIVDALHRVHHFISAITDVDALLDRVMEESKHIAHAEACSLMLYDPATEELYFQVALGESGDQQALKREVRLKLNQGIGGAAAAKRQPISVEDVQFDPRFYPVADETSHFHTRSVLAVPLLDRDKLVGVLEVVNKTGGGPFTEADLHVMEMFSVLAAAAIVNARLIEENVRAERLAAIGEAVASLSHYIKNVITGMGSSADLIDDGLERDNAELLKKIWPVFRRSTRRIAHFVENMLAFSRPRTPQLRECDLKQIIDDVAETFWGLLVHKHVALEIDAEEMSGPVYVEPQGMFRCLLNLLINAADAVPSMGGKIRVVVHGSPGGALDIDVADNGPGVPEEHLHRIFEPFFSTKGSQGTGLGLAVTQKIVREHGGEIRVLPSPEGGALFRIRLPQVPRT